MAIQDITKPMALDETLQATNGKMDSVITKLQGIIDALGLDPSVYKPAGSKTCAELLPALLIADNLGNVYNITDSGTTTSDFVEGLGKPIPAGSNVAIVDVGTGGSHVYKFDLLAGMIDLTNYVQKSATAGLIKNDGTIDTKNYAEKPSSSTSGNLASLDGNGNLADSGWKSDKTTTAVSGNPISISGLKSNQLAVNPIITLEPIQAGSGDPSPSNIRAISGYDKIEVLSCGKNIYDKNNNGQISNAYVDSIDNYCNDNTCKTIIISCKSNTYYTVSKILSSRFTIGYTEIYPTVNHTPVYGQINDNSATSLTILTGASARYLVAYIYNSNYDSSLDNILNSLQVEEGNQATTYESYNPITDIQLQLGETIYGGSLDVNSGKLTVDRGYAIFDGSSDEVWHKSGVYAGSFYIVKPSDIKSSNPQIICNMAVPNVGSYSQGEIIIDSDINVWIGTENETVTEFKTWLGSNNLQVCYKLATPIEIQLTPHEISLLKDYAYVSTNGTSIAFDYHNGEMASLGDIEALGETVNWLGESSQLEVVNYPYSSFSWDNSEKAFKLVISIDHNRLLGFIVQATNGAAMMNAYYNSSYNTLRVFGWIPSAAVSIDSNYQFLCYGVLKRSI